jgi:hypothetical protein
VRHLTDRLSRALDAIDTHVANQANCSSGEGAGDGRVAAAVPAIQTLAVVGGVAANQVTCGLSKQDSHKVTCGLSVTRQQPLSLTSTFFHGFFHSLGGPRGAL